MRNTAIGNSSTDEPRALILYATQRIKSLSVWKFYDIRNKLEDMLITITEGHFIVIILHCECTYIIAPNTVVVQQ